MPKIAGVGHKSTVLTTVNKLLSVIYDKQEENDNKDYQSMPPPLTAQNNLNDDGS